MAVVVVGDPNVRYRSNESGVAVEPCAKIEQIETPGARAASPGGTDEGEPVSVARPEG